MKQLLQFLFLGASLFSFAQDNTEAINKINAYSKNDTIKVEMMVDLCVNNTFANSTDNLKYATKAFDLSKKLNYRTGIIRSLNCLGNFYYQQSILDRATKYYTEALTIAEKADDYQNIVIGKSNLGNIYLKIGQNEKAIQSLTEADKILVATGNEYSQNRAAVLTNLASVYTVVKEYDKALGYFKKTLQICKKKNILFGAALTNSNIGATLVTAERYNEALPYMLSSENEAKKNGYPNLLGMIYTNLAKIYLFNNQNQLAISKLEEGVAHCKKYNDNENLINNLKLLQSEYAKSNNYQKAYATVVDYIKINDSIFNITKQKDIAEINTKYETEKKEATIKDLNQKKKITELESNKKTILINSFIISFVALISIAYFLFSRFKAKKKNELLETKLAEAQKLLEAEKKATDSELKALKSQMNPHFIFNALNSIQAQFMYGDKITANEQLNNFTYLTRQILEVSGKKQIPIATEIEILSKYLDLEKMRFAKDFEYKITVSNAIDQDYHKLPPMLLQPFIENSVKHGLMHKKGLKTISINFEIDANEAYLICTIIDNGIGRAKSAEIKANNQSQHNSFSTQSIEERLSLLNEKLQLNHLITYSDVVENDVVAGTKVVLNIPIV